MPSVTHCGVRLTWHGSGLGGARIAIEDWDALDMRLDLSLALDPATEDLELGCERLRAEWQSTGTIPPGLEALIEREIGPTLRERQADEERWPTDPRPWTGGDVRDAGELVEDAP